MRRSWVTHVPCGWQWPLLWALPWGPASRAHLPSSASALLASPPRAVPAALALCLGLCTVTPGCHGASRMHMGLSHRWQPSVSVSRPQGPLSRVGFYRCNLTDRLVQAGDSSPRDRGVR